ncbi:MAG: YqgE/AlgH family protein [Gammaproteobacteria bacterium]|jgi:putative transcriptional regulator|nr:YqgE/AlgH family protein [Gammaproteobacteria bacterium]MBP6051414.1 YqgE/AlgH family protein [Pseudomonadales bacterium]MBK6582813.1 YqgE/AlgH family protein [Gammaproteobacteria bacterium]MBK7171305.1 YqgE/AlgH family protein [Gammaproteobacteria bacterium]MBK7518943.1 YqgE/AlgH family protein [Gammaproteobacteria bacterium]
MSDTLRNHFLIAMPGMDDSRFAHSITYLCEHNENGAMGIVINRALDLSFDDIFEHLDIENFPHHHDQPILAGGPVQTDRGFVLHRHNDRKRWQSTLDISDEISLTTSRDILEAIAHDDGPSDALIALGYAGWAPGQLEQELAGNAWLSLPAEAHILFDVPLERRAQAAAARLGFNLDLLSGSCGTA